MTYEKMRTSSSKSIAISCAIFSGLVSQLPDVALPPIACVQDQRHFSEDNH